MLSLSSYLSLIQCSVTHALSEIYKYPCPLYWRDMFLSQSDSISLKPTTLHGGSGGIRTHAIEMTGEITLLEVSEVNLITSGYLEK